MKDIIPADTRYVPQTQQKWCCVPTCIQMIMLRHNIPLISSEVIGYHMGLIVPKGASKLFWNARTGKRPPAGYGTQAGKPQFAPNTMFKKLGIPLKMSISLIDKFENIESFREFLAKEKNSEKDILVCFDWPSLFDPKSEDHWGHVCVLDRVYLDKDEIRIIDPEHIAPKWQMIPICKMYESMKLHGKENSAGFWELQKSN